MARTPKTRDAEAKPRQKIRVMRGNDTSRQPAATPHEPRSTLSRDAAIHPRATNPTTIHGSLSMGQGSGSTIHDQRPAIRYRHHRRTIAPSRHRHFSSSTGLYLLPFRRASPRFQCASPRKAWFWPRHRHEGTAESGRLRPSTNATARPSSETETAFAGTTGTPRGRRLDGSNKQAGRELAPLPRRM